MKKSIFLFFAAILCAVSVNAEMIYLKTSANWREGNAEFWIHSWEGTDSYSPRKMEYLGCGIYGSEAGDHTKCLFVRQESGKSEIQWSGNWYQTADLTINNTQRCYKVVNWHENGTGWIATPTFPTIAGDEGLLGANWDPANADNKMTKQDDGTYTLVKTVTLEANTYLFKVTDGTWDWSLGDPNASNNDKNAELTISEAGEYNVTFTYNPTAETVSATAEKVEVEEPETPAEGEIAGEFTFEISNLEVTDYEDFGVMEFKGSGMDKDNNFNLIVDLYLDTNNQNDDGSFNLASADIAPSTLTLEGVGELTIGETYIEATLETLDAIILAIFNGQTYKFNISMSKGSSETTPIEIIQEATMTVNEWGMLILSSEWTNDADGITYPISLEIAGFINTKSYTYFDANITVGGQGDADPWLGFGQSSSVTVTIEDGELAIEGTFTGTIGTANVYMWASFNVPNETLYFVNTDSWSEVSAYAWYPNPDGGNYNENSWPGATLNKTNKTIYGKDVYEFTYPAGSYQFVIFNGKVNNETKQTADLACTPGQYFVYNFDSEITSNCWRKETYLKQFYVVGTHNEWNVNDYKNRIVVDDNNEASKTLTLAAGTHELKVTAGSWTFAWGYDNLKNKEGVTTNNDGNIVIALQKETDVTIAFNSSTLEITLSGLTTEEPEVPTDPEPAENVVYFVNTAGWTTVNVYAWSPENGSWPGVALQSTDIVEQIGGYDVYKYAPDATYTNVIFNNINNGSGTKTADLAWENGKYYVYNGNDNVDADDWYDKSEVEDALPTPTSLTYTVKVPAGTPECYITGENTGGFGTFVKMNPAAEADVFTVDIAWATESQKYKYSASASWDYEEVNEDGSSVTDRTWQARDEVKKWKTDPTAQVTPVDAYTVTVPEGTIECYICGAWDWSKFEKMELVPGETNKYTISIPTATSIHKYKYTCGPDWKYAEDGADRTWDSEEDVVTKWLEIYNPNVVEDFSNQPSTLYFRPNTNWKVDNARFAAYFFGTEEKWADMTDSNSDGIYEVANDKANANVIFCRMNPSAAENKWENKWNQTCDIVIPNEAENLNTVWTPWKNVFEEREDDKKLYGIWAVPETIGSGDNTAFYNKYNGKTINVIVERTFTDVLHTLCLPFSLPANWIGTAYQLSGVQSNTAEELVLYVKKCDTFEAGKPYIVEPTNEELAAKEYLLVDNVTISTSLASNSVSNKTHVVTLKGILNGGGQTDGAIEYYIGTDGALHKEPTNKLALRSIVEITDKSGNPVQGVRARVAFNENVETGVEDIIAPDAPVKVIVNGQLIIIRDGEMYNVQGQLVK